MIKLNEVDERTIRQQHMVQHCISTISDANKSTRVQRMNLDDA
jgi:hypothetical protein